MYIDNINCHVMIIVKKPKNLIENILKLSFEVQFNRILYDILIYYKYIIRYYNLYYIYIIDININIENYNENNNIIV